ncbi:CPCC family cysteine-rich protein [Desulfosporosinus youngiae]|uniref:Cysteine-rich CPCC domain-containing protein n=1 Tax=Desulfosporosinus youngiae DSM 17734 TaxID=768710 RepID=H5XW58_9FIRM|nr:hypothetical protein DesyoDRAFT_3653 [Desulfosporosinus youngiae DSM 17734]
MKYKCPCCGYYTFENKPVKTHHDGSFDICSICFWEDDPLQLEKPIYEGGANRVSLVQAQKSFNNFGACRQDMIPHVRKPTENEYLIKYFYEELIMSLVTMSLPAKEQKYMIGIGYAGDEILEDFSNFYNDRKQFYLDNNVFDDRQIRIWMSLIDFLISMTVMLRIFIGILNN